MTITEIKAELPDIMVKTHSGKLYKAVLNGRKLGFAVINWHAENGSVQQATAAWSTVARIISDAKPLLV